jgi:hypothetical protein
MSIATDDSLKIGFRCTIKYGRRKEQWLGHVSSINHYAGHVELFIGGRSSIRVLCGESRNGLWACIPDYDAGCVLSSLTDTFFNTENLYRAMKNKVDAITVAEALRAIADKGLFNRE